MSHRKPLRLLLMLLGLAWPGMPLADEPGPGNAVLAAGFVRLAFGVPRTVEPPALWRHGPVRVAVLGEAGRSFKARLSLDLLLARLAPLLPGGIEQGGGTDADVLLVFATEPARELLGPRAGLARAIFPDQAEREAEMGAIRGVACKAWFAHSSEQPVRMVRVLAAIRSGQPADGQWACMVDVVIRALGFRENRIEADWTMFGTDGPWREPTVEDWLMLRLLHDPALTEEEDDAAALVTARRLLDGWRPGRILR